MHFGMPDLARIAGVAVAALVAASCLGEGEPGPSAQPPDDATSQWRPEAHYTPVRNWMNDPNGLVHHDGLWHLFYQYNPDGDGWGNISWGHATSPDLVRWTEQPVALRATDAEQVFSGSVVVDHVNTSGLGESGAAPMVAIYTSAYAEDSGHVPGTQAQSLAYSTDGGTTWRRYEHNPVLTLDPESRSFRDPKVFWYTPGGFWVMVAVVADAHVVKLYRSPDLLRWHWMSDVSGIGATGGVWEMPDLFPLPVDGDPDQQRWVLVVNINPGAIAGGSGAQYFVGSFDGTTFRPADGAPASDDPVGFRWVDHGADVYALGTWNDAPDGRRVGIAWMSNWDYAEEVPTAPWRGAMTVPRELALRTIDGRPTLVSRPVAELDGAAARSSFEAPALEVESTERELPATARGTAQRIDVVVDVGTATEAGVIVRSRADGSQGTRIVVDASTGSLRVDRSESGATDFSPRFSAEHTAPLVVPESGRVALTIVVDRSSVEVFANGGAVTLTDVVLPEERSDRVHVFADGGTAVFRDLTVLPLGA